MRRPAEQGFILIEAMIAILIMGLALVVLGLLLASSERNSVRSSQRNQTTLDLVEREMRAVRATSSWANVVQQSAPSCSSPAGQDAEWCSHRRAASGNSQVVAPAGSGGLAPIGTGEIGRSDYDVYRYVWCVSADGSAAAASATCPLKRVRIVVETQGQGLARRLPPDGIASRDVVMSSTLYATPVS